MTLALQVVAYLVGVPLEILIIAALLRGGYKRYPFAFLYILADFITTAIEIRPALSMYLGLRGSLREYVLIYWIDERIMNVLMFLLVISLIHSAASNSRSSRSSILVISGATAAVAATSFLFHYSPGLLPGQWMTPFTRDLNFVAAILDMALWFRLLAQPRRDYRLMMLSSALGVQFTGQAIGHSFRFLLRAPWLRDPIGILLTLLNLVFLYLFWRAVRVPKEERRAPLLDTHAEEAAGSGPLPPR